MNIMFFFNSFLFFDWFQFGLARNQKFTYLENLPKVQTKLNQNLR